jgi:hypothetical protein
MDVVFKLIVSPTQTGELLVGEGVAGGLTIVTEVVPAADVQPLTVIVRL